MYGPEGLLFGILFAVIALLVTVGFGTVAGLFGVDASWFVIWVMHKGDAGKVEYTQLVFLLPLLVSATSHHTREAVDWKIVGLTGAALSPVSNCKIFDDKAFSLFPKKRRMPDDAPSQTDSRFRRGTFAA